MKNTEKVLAGIVQECAAERGENPAPEEFILTAMQKLDAGEIRNVDRLPTGVPSVKGIHQAALMLFGAHNACCAA